MGVYGGNVQTSSHLDRMGNDPRRRYMGNEKESGSRPKENSLPIQRRELSTNVPSQVEKDETGVQDTNESWTEEDQKEFEKWLKWWSEVGNKKLAKDNGVAVAWLQEEQMTDGFPYFEEYGMGTCTLTHRAKHKVGRNEPCPCGSGKKYKKCHGK